MKIDRLKRSKKNVMLSEAERSRSISLGEVAQSNGLLLHARCFAALCMTFLFIHV